MSLTVLQPDRWHWGKKSIYNHERHSYLLHMGHSGNIVFNGLFSSASYRQRYALCTVLYFLTDVTVAPFDRKYVLFLLTTEINEVSWEEMSSLYPQRYYEQIGRV